MTAPANRWKLGLFVLAGIGFGAGGVAFLGARELRRAAHTAYAYFDEAVTGLEEGSPVKFRGVTIGVVDRIRVAPDKKHLEVMASLYDDYLRDLGLDVDRLDDTCPLPELLRAQIVMSWVTSTAFVQIDFFPDPPAGPQQLPFAARVPMNTLRTVPSTAKSLEAAVREVLTELPRTTLSIRELVDMLRGELEAARLAEVSRRLQSLLSAAEQQFAKLEQYDTVAAASRALQEINTTATALRDEQAPLGKALREWTDLGETLRRELEAAQIAAMSAGVKSAADGVTAASGDLSIELRQLHATLVSVQRLADLLERDPGALLHGRGSSGAQLEGRK